MSEGSVTYAHRRQPRLVIRNAEILDIGSSQAAPIRGDVVIEGNLIVAIGPGAAAGIPEDPSDLDGSRRLLIPGLANTHFHSPGNLMKGAIPNLPLDLYMLFEVSPTMTEPVSAELARLRTLLGAAEMLRQGVTAVHDDAFFLPIVTEGEVDAVMSAYAESGLRATVALDQPNVPEWEKHALLAEHLPEDLRQRMAQAPRQSTAELLAAYERFIGRWHGRAGGRLRAALSCSAPQRVEVAYFEALARLSAEADLPFNLHLLETRDQRLFGDLRLGRSLVRYAEDHKALSERSQVIHAVWIDDEDIAILADRGAGVAHNPVCNLRLGSGVMPFRRLTQAGVSLGIGTDEANVDDGVNYWTAVKVAGLIHNLGQPDFTLWPQPDELLRAATSGGYRNLCLPQPAGVLRAGALADLVLLDLDSLVFTPRHDLLRQLVYCEPARAVTEVIVDGELTVRNGQLCTIDERALAQQIAELNDEITDYAQACAQGAALLWPAYEAAYQAGLAQATSPSYGRAGAMGVD